MTTKTSDALKISAEYFSGKLVGKSLREVAVDMIQTESEDLVSRWYHGASNTDLFTWADRGQNIIKQQLNFNGQVVEWNCLEGVKTGVVIEQDLDNDSEATASVNSATKNQDTKIGPSETIQFDTKPQGFSVALALEILQHMEADLDLRQQLMGNFKNPQNIETMPPEAFLKRFGLALKNYEKQDHGFWQNLKARFRAIFNR